MANKNLQEKTKIELSKKSSDGVERGDGGGGGRQVELAKLFYCFFTPGYLGRGEGAAVSFPNELNVMNEVESWKTHRGAASNSRRHEASRGKGEGRRKKKR